MDTIKAIVDLHFPDKCVKAGEEVQVETAKADFHVKAGNAIKVKTKELKIDKESANN